MKALRTASPELEAFNDEAIEIAIANGYNPTIFKGMRARYGTLEAMERIVQNGEIQSGFKRLKALGLAEKWSVEAGILKFASKFSRNAVECARWRLRQLDDT